MKPNEPAWTVPVAADVLMHAETAIRDREPITDQWTDLDLGTAYSIQDELVARKVAGGERIVGIKLGLTSRPKQERMGISSPLTGWLTDAMMLDLHTPVPMGELIHPRVEPEIVFVLGERLAGPGVTVESAMAAVASVHAGLEVIDSRFIDFKFTLPDVVADNASSARFYVSSRGFSPDDLDLVAERCVLSVDGAEVATATGAAVQGHPGQALALAANSLAERGVVLEPGWIVLTGGLTDAVFVHPGTVVAAEFDHLGTVSTTGGSST